MSETIHEVENASELFVPTVLDFLQANLNSLLDELWTVQALAEVHDEPHRLDSVTGIELATVETIDEVAVLAQSFNDEAELGAIEDVHDLMQAVIDGLLQEGGVKEGFNLKGDVAENHRQVEGL